MPALLGCLVLLVAVLGFVKRGAAEDGPAVPVDFAADVLPVLSDKCFACHGPGSDGDSGLRLDTFAAATADLGGYQAIDPANVEESELLVRIESPDDPMPPADAEKQLSEYEKSLLRDWIQQGGQYQQHWAFVPPSKSAATQGVASEDVIDTLIAARLQKQNVGLATPAPREVLARRAALTLTGLPPEPQQLQAFLADSAPGAYERYVDRLFEDPGYGEHQARYWLDAVRYGDTHGLHLDNRRGIYPYRDWVVRALNQNLPLDDFVVWQLAGDLLPEPSMDQLIATGFVRMNPTTSEGGVIPDEFQAKNNFDRTETLGTVLLGMTLTCARCHSHKYDPISQTEYYQLLAFFNSTAESPLDGNKYDYGPSLKVPSDQQSWQAWRAMNQLVETLAGEAADSLGDSAADNQTDANGFDLSQWQAKTLAEKLDLLADPQGPFADTSWAGQAKWLSKQLESAEADFTTTLIARDLPQPRPTHVLRRGEYDMPMGEPLSPGVPAIMGDLPEAYPRNRLGLARWLTADDHPLVTRVLVNRLWQQVFGNALVRTPEDFGAQGSRPTHPQLLDWLAVELRESGWDMKHMLRLMVTSETFKQSSVEREDIEDPENVYFARGPRYRLDAEVLRDMGLWVSDLLDPTMGGEGVKPYQPDGMWFAMAHPASNTKQYVRDQGQRLYRRSLYVYWKRTSPHPMMTLFDAPDRESSCVRRSRTSTPLQSLGLLNETQRIEMARKLAERLMRSQPEDAARIDQLYQWLACRPAGQPERDACLSLLQAMKSRYAEAEEDAKALLTVGDAEPAKELAVTELAAWTQVCVTVLASDAVLMMY